MQSELAANLSRQSGLDLVRFRYADCLLFFDEEIMKMLLPRSKRIMGGGPKDRIVTGELILLLRSDLQPLSAPSKKYDWPKTAFGCPIANFPWLLKQSILEGGEISKGFFDGVGDLLSTLPSTGADWRETFDSDPSEWNESAVFCAVVGFPRSRVRPN